MEVAQKDGNTPQMPSPASAHARSAGATVDEMRHRALLIVQGELIGRRVRVLALKADKPEATIEGVIVDETRDTVVIERGSAKDDGKKGSEKNRRLVRVIKDQHTFEIRDSRGVLRVKGSLLARRPEDRLKIKIRW